jgi:putative membrane-bound dehydrogenase-like protein
MRAIPSLLPALLLLSTSLAANPVRVLFLGHESEHHNSNEFYPMLAKALGRDAIYFDYTTSVETALGDAEYLGKFDALLLYANHPRLTAKQWENLQNYVRQGGGFVPVHCASWCFSNIPGYDQLVGGRFKSHQTGTFSAKIIQPSHPALSGVTEFEAWDETYFHNNHNPEGRTVLMVREVMPGDTHTTPEPWTWVRTEGKGRIFYTASGHDERVWNQPGFHQLLKSGILWSIGEKAKARYDQFLTRRKPLTYEKRDNIPNYERRPAPLPYQHPLEAKDSLDYTQVPVGFHLELFAAEPDVINPIYIQWDERGRLWVAESVDYPNTITPDRKGNDRIKILEDTDGDGKADKATTFVDGLNVVTSFTFARGGIIVANAPDFLFLKDTDGDDKADTKEVILSGFGIGDTHAGPSNLRYGPDNWIYGTVGYSRFQGKVNGKEHNFGSGVFRFKPDGSEIEFLHQFNNNTWGLGFNEAGDTFGSTANNNPSFFGGIPATLYDGKRGLSAKMIADTPKFQPITPNIRQVDAFNAYTAGCGHAFSNSPNFPESWRGNRSFICGPTGNLVGMYDYLPDGAGYKAKNAFSLVASADEWFSPIVAEVGPDGNLWLADWYNFIIQHNPTPSVERGGYKAVNGRGNAHENPNRDKQHGRIYRLVYEGKQDAPTPKANLVQALAHPNQFWRLTAQRLLVEGQKTDLVPALKELAKQDAPGAIHAIWTLHGLGQLDPLTHLQLLLHKDPAIRRNALRTLGSGAQATQLLFDSATLTDKEPQVRLAAFVKLAQQEDKSTASQTASKLLGKPENAEDEWLIAALKAAGAQSKEIVGYQNGPNLLDDPSFEKGLQGWKFRNYSGPADAVDAAIETDTKHVRTGKNSFRLGSKAGHDTSYHRPLQLEAGKQYRLSAWIQTEGIQGAYGAMLNIHELQKQAKTEPISGTSEWKESAISFTVPRSGTFTLNCLLGGWGKSKGTAWFDDISLTESQPIYAEPVTTKTQAGDTEKGRNLFHNHAIASCIRCHKLNGKGGDIGPVLDGIASKKTRDYLLESLVKPSATLAEGFEKLGVSPMPPMDLLLDEQELADLLAYLLTFK